MKIYVSKLYSYQYAHEGSSQPQIVGVSQNMEKAKQIIYRELITEKQIFSIVWDRYVILDEDEFSLGYPELSSIHNFRERADKYLDEEENTVDIAGLSKEFLNDIVDLPLIETVIRNSGYYRYEIEEHILTD